jgi:hypothetical protein
MAKRKKSGGQKTAEAAKKKAAKLVRTYASKAKAKPLNKQQKAKQKAAKETVRTAKRYIAAANAARDMSYEELQEARSAEMTQRGSLTGQAKFDEGLQARAYADYMRQETGRQKGQGTPYTGPGATVVQDDEGNIVRGPQGRVQYQIDPEAYAKRFIPQFKPTEEQLGMGLNIQPGLLTPWQQTNFQWLLGEEGLDPTAEGRIPGAFRQDWREEQWGDVYDPKTGLWKRAEDSKVRADAVAEQLRRYNAGEFNPTVGSVAGDRWTGAGVGVASADQWLPPGWTPGADTATGGGREYLTTPYTRPALQDWSDIMPPEGLLTTPAQRAIVANQGANYQPWAQGGLIEYSPAGTATYVPRTYTPAVTPSVSTSPTSTGVVNQPWVGPGGVTDFAAYQQAEHDRMYPGRQAMANVMGGGGLNFFGQGGADFRSQVPSNSADWLARYGQQGPVLGVDYNATGLLNQAPALTVQQQFDAINAPIYAGHPAER